MNFSNMGTIHCGREQFYAVPVQLSIGFFKAYYILPNYTDMVTI